MWTIALRELELGPRQALPMLAGAKGTIASFPVDGPPIRAFFVSDRHGNPAAIFLLILYPAGLVFRVCGEGRRRDTVISDRTIVGWPQWPRTRIDGRTRGKNLTPYHEKYALVRVSQRPRTPAYGHVCLFWAAEQAGLAMVNRIMDAPFPYFHRFTPVLMIPALRPDADGALIRLAYGDLFLFWHWLERAGDYIAQD